MDPDLQKEVYNQYMNMIEPLAQIIIEDARDYMAYAEEAGYIQANIVDKSKGYLITIKQIEHEQE